MFKVAPVLGSLLGIWLITGCGVPMNHTKASVPADEVLLTQEPAPGQRAPIPVIAAVNMYQFIKYGEPVLAIELLHNDLDVDGDMNQTHVDFALNGKGRRWGVFFEKAQRRSVFYAYDAVGDLTVTGVHLKLVDGTLFELEDLRGIKSNVALPGPVAYASLPQYTP